MKIVVCIVCLCLSLPVFGQDLAQCGLDDQPVLTATEAAFLQQYMTESQRNGVDFSNKKVLFVEGTTGQRLQTKSTYFDFIKQWQEKEAKIATWTVELTEAEKAESGGYDMMVTCFVKFLPKGRKRRIIKAANHRI